MQNTAAPDGERKKTSNRFVDPKFENNVILTGTEFLTMNTRPKIPANARNLNCCIIGSSGSGKTRFWLTPQLLHGYERGKGWLHKRVSFDNLFTSMRYLGYALAGKPYMGIGRNMAYRKELFYAQKGFSAHLNLQRGDDDLFINKTATAENTRIETDANAVVRVQPVYRAKDWREEKISYMGTAHFYRGIQRYLSGFETTTRLLFHAAWITALVIGILNFHWLAAGIAFLLFALRYTLQALIINKTAKDLGEKRRYIFTLPVFDILQPMQSLRWKLLIALALTPAFKMKFWNIGGEGQVLIGGLAAAACMICLGDKLPNAVVILCMIVASLAAGAIWGFIPAFFKAKWNTNETLSTLMMNYIATQLVAFYTIVWEVPKGSGKIGIINQNTNVGWLPQIFGSKYLWQPAHVGILVDDTDLTGSLGNLPYNGIECHKLGSYVVHHQCRQCLIGIPFCLEKCRNEAPDGSCCQAGHDHAQDHNCVRKLISQTDHTGCCCQPADQHLSLTADIPEFHLKCRSQMPMRSKASSGVIRGL